MVVNIRKPMVNEIKRQILQVLRESGDHLSGERLAEGFGTSRVSVWSQIRSLREDGYVIEASRTGYRLISSPDLLLPYEFPGLEDRIHYFPVIGSTMDAARELATKGAGEGTIVIAESQTHGRGRLNRAWLSPIGGIYFTLILRPEIRPTYAPRINLMASVAVATTIRKLLGLNAGLKWPNDVLIEGKKVCGILAEIDAELDAVNYVNLGIGINVNASIPQFEKTATSLKQALGRDICRRQFLIALLKEIECWQALLMEADLLEQWRRLSVTLTKDIRIVAPGEVIVGKAIDVDVTGALIVEERNGSLKKVLAGDCIQ